MKIFLFIINGLGIGSLPDYSKYDSDYNCTALNIGCLDTLATLNKLGIVKCCLKEVDSTPIGYFLRGRMCTTSTTYADGLNEILGNAKYSENTVIKENLVDILRKHDFEVSFLSSRNDSIAEEIFAQDSDLADYICNTEFASDDIVIAEFNDFAKYGLLNDVDNMEKSIKFIDKFLGKAIMNIGGDDVLFVTGNFGINPSKIGITREYNPIFAYSKSMVGNKNLQTIQGNSAIAMSIVDMLNIYPNNKGFLDINQKSENLGINDKIVTRIDKLMEFKPASNDKPSALDKIKSIKDKLLSKKQK